MTSLRRSDPIFRFARTSRGVVGELFRAKLLAFSKTEGEVRRGNGKRLQSAEEIAALLPPNIQGNQPSSTLLLE